MASSVAPVRMVDAVADEPTLDQIGPRSIEHPRQHLRGDLHHAEAGFQRQDGVQDGEGDEPGPHQDDVALLADLGHHSPRLLQGPETVDARQIRARHGRLDG